MKTLHRNKQTFYYSNYLDKLPLKDENGDLTGEYTNYYSVPASALGYITAARGQAELDMFGVNTNYTKTIITDYDLGLTEDSILWIENDTAHSYDYIVVAVAKSLNHFTYAIRAVNVDYTVPFAVDLGTLEWMAITGIFLSTVPKAVISSVGWCETYTQTTTIPPADKQFVFTVPQFGGFNIMIKDTDYSTAEDFKSAMAGVWLYYE